MNQNFFGLLGMFSPSEPEPEPGDMIWFQRFGYQHWGIYAGNGELIHFTLPDWMECGRNIVAGETLTATVRREALTDVAGVSPLYGVNNQFDSPRNPPASREDIVRRAERLVGLELPYNLLRSNCEHFATMMRYDVPQPGQASFLGFDVDPEFMHQTRQALRRTHWTVPRPTLRPPRTVPPPTPHPPRTVPSPTPQPPRTVPRPTPRPPRTVQRWFKN